MSAPPNPPYPLQGPPKPISVPLGTSLLPGWSVLGVTGPRPVLTDTEGNPTTEWAVAPYCTCKGKGAGSAFVDRGDGKYVAACCLRPSRAVYEFDGAGNVPNDFEGRAFGPGESVTEIDPTSPDDTKIRLPFMHPFLRSAEGSGRVCMAAECGLGPDAAVHQVSNTLEMSEEDRRTYALQAVGPDEFPEGYYRHLAREELAARAEADELAAAEAAGHTEAVVCPSCHGRGGNSSGPCWDCQGGAAPAPSVFVVKEPEGMRCVHDMLPDYCAPCTGVEAPEVMSVVFGTELPPETSLTWSTGCSCDSETLDLMGCACGGVGAAAVPPPPIPAADVASFVARANTPPPPIPAPVVPVSVTPEPASGNVDSPTPAPLAVAVEEGSTSVTHETTAEAAVHGPRRMFSNSELRTFKRCRRKWWLTYYRKLTARREGVGALSIGNMVHWPLEVYYGTANRDPETFDWETPLAQHVEARLADPNLPDHLHERMLGDYELVKIMLRGYFGWLVEEGADSELNILAPEREIEAFIDTIDGMDVWLIGKLDVEAELRSDGRRVFIDHKSVANLADIPKIGQIDEQQPTYGLLQRLESAALAAAGEPHAETFARGGVWNMLRKVKRTAAAKPPFYGRAGVSHNDEVYRNFYKRVWGEARDILATTRNLDAGGDPIVEVYPMPTRDCAWDCPFFGICPMFDDGSDVEAVIEMEYVVHDPYARYTEIEKG